MIECKKYEGSFRELRSHKGFRSDYLSPSSAKLLDEFLSDQVGYMVVEYPYVDADFRSSYYRDFSKRHKPISRDSYRIHLFSGDSKVPFTNDQYLGYLTLRQTPKYSIGRSYLSPKAVKHSVGYCMLSTYKAHLLGKELVVQAFPWMQQDINTTRCAHIAAWSIMRYFSRRQPQYSDIPLAEMANSLGSQLRSVPSHGLTLQQMAQLLSSVGFSVQIMVRPKDDPKPNRFETKIFHYIESGLPVIASLNKEHAVALVGHGNVSSATKANLQGIQDSSTLLPSLLCSDDNFLPYRELFREKTNHSLPSFQIEHIDAILIPMHEKMYTTPDELLGLLLPSVENRKPLIDKTLVRRVFLSSSKELKLATAKVKDKVYRDYVFGLALPKFVWVVEYASPECYDKQLAEYRLVIDSTATVYDEDAIVFFQQPGMILDYSEGENVIDLRAQQTPFLTNNLIRI
ncbi:MAG: hypothetical protein RRB13_09135 [bacterium]|nr:hypothetical protein [bacterium]